MGLLRLLLAALILHLILVQPNHPDALTVQALFLFPLELPVILLALLALPARSWITTCFRHLLVAALMTIAVLKIADFASFTAFNRSFNPVVDMGLVGSAWQLASGAIGVPLATGVVVLAVVILLLVAAGVWWATGQWARVEPPRFVLLWRGFFGLATIAALTVMIADIGAATRHWTLPFAIPGSAFTARVGYERSIAYRRTLADLRDFRALAASDPFLIAPPDLALIGDRDVILVFVESYGRASFDNPLYAPTHRATLAAAEAAIARDGVTMRSGWLTAPMTGGQSWLAHSSIASGLWVSDQTRYRSYLQSNRQTLFHLAQKAGFTTAAVMPAVTMPWPEALKMGFDIILPAAELGYQGLPFNWVTMPDQFTLTAFDRLVREPTDQRVFAQIALVSSHAPWVPVPTMIPWDDVGDGTAFNPMAQSGDPPDVVWRDRDRVREQYRLAIDYSLQAIMSYVAEQDKMPLFVILGDHQSAGFVAGSESFNVPIHIIGPSDAMAAIEDWGFTPGLIPAEDAPSWPMDEFRDRFLTAFSSARN